MSDVTQDPGLRIPAQWVKWAVEVGGDPFNIERARRLALELMDEHGVSDWKFRIGSGKDQAGSISYWKKDGRWDGRPGTLTLSGPLMSLWDEGQRRNTILHEVAHLLCPGTGHGQLWRYHAQRLGALPERLWGELGEEKIPRPWKGACPGGHPHRERRNRPRQLWWCMRCVPNAIITWTKEGT